jgi:hypothetical protein
MRLARDTRQTLGLAIEALIELLDAVGPDPSKGFRISPEPKLLEFLRKD